MRKKMGDKKKSSWKIILTCNPKYGTLPLSESLSFGSGVGLCWNEKKV